MEEGGVVKQHPSPEFACLLYFHHFTIFSNSLLAQSIDQAEKDKEEKKRYLIRKVGRACQEDWFSSMLFTVGLLLLYYHSESIKYFNSISLYISVVDLGGFLYSNRSGFGLFVGFFKN